MIEVFASISSAEVGVRRAMLEEAGIPTFVGNEALSVLTNGFAAPFQPALCVINEEDYAEAMNVLRTLTAPQVRDDWHCPKCEEWVPNTFDSCWKCETVRPDLDPAAS